MNKVVLLLTIALGLTFTRGFALENPAAPQVRVIGPAGQVEAAYWLVAEDAQGRTTNVSKPALVRNLPEQPADAAAGLAEITIPAVEGAVKYYLLKTVMLRPPANVRITPGAAGDKTFYYWIAAQNTWRLSELGGPYILENAAGAAGNVLKWDPVPTANNYQIFRTERPVKPFGYTTRAIGDTQPLGQGEVRTRFTDSDRLGSGWNPAGFPATAVGARPQGLTNCLLETVGAENLAVIDKGQPLRLFKVPTVNSTKRIPFDMNADKHADLRDAAGRPSAVFLEAHERLKANRPTFGTGANLLSLKQTAESGGHSDRNRSATNAFQGKSNHHVIEMNQNLHVATQAMTLGGYQRGYGSGDMIFFHPHQAYYGTNNDGGDEGVYPIRQSIERHLNRHDSTLAESAPQGATRIKFANMAAANFGTERLVVNFSKAYAEGRVVKVAETTVTGKGTEWTPDLEGWWISFEIENVMVDRQLFRMWYMISRVDGPTQLSFRAFTNWSDYENLGYTRWIYDPEKQGAPAARVPGNPLAIRNLPDDRRQAAAEGKYLIASATMLGDPWKENGYFNVAPLNRAWDKGDKVAIVGGPQAFIGGGRIMLFGNYLPQDLVTGLQLRNTGNRKTNSAGIEIGTTGAENFADGIRIVLAKDGHGNGIVIANSTTWDADGLPAGGTGVHDGALVLPSNLPAVTGTPAAQLPHLRFNHGLDAAADSLEIQSPAGRPMLTCTAAGENIISAPTEFRQEVRFPAAMRGRLVFSGDGVRKSYAVKFAQPCKEPPVVTFSTNQFAAARLAAVGADGFEVEFQTPPEKGADNVLIYYWLAM